MPVGTVSTLAIYQTTINDVSKVINNLNTEQGQLSSGNTSQNFEGIATNSQEYLSLDNVIQKTSQYLNDNQNTEARINTTSSVLSQVINTATSLQGLIEQRLSGVGNNAAFSTLVGGVWQQLAGQLNTTVENQFIFSGTKTNVPTVNPNNFPTLVNSPNPDASYYQGSTQDITATPQDATPVVVNVRGDSPGFQKIIAAIALATQGDHDSSTQDLAQAENLVQAGMQDIINTQAIVNANQVQFSTIDTSLQNSKLYLQGVQQSIGNTDIVSVSTQVAINQGILQAAFQAFSKINSLSLVDFLK